MIAHRINGQGEPLLLLNGGMMTMAGWQPIAEPLEASFQVIRCDFRGQLLSPGEPEPSLGAHVRDVLEVLDGLGIERVHVVGASFGAEVGLLLAALHPGRVRSLSAVTAGGKATDELRAAFGEMRRECRKAAETRDGSPVFDMSIPGMYTEAYREARREALAQQRAWFSAFPAIWFQGLDRIVAAVEDFDLTPVLPRIQCPVLVVAAEEDKTFPLEEGRALAAAIPGARLEVVPAVGHGLILEKSERLTEILLGFLGTLRSTS
ncbi:MAG TPA: alpha/beta hydrolase [Thermoanaerobaculia bacterium]